MIAYTYTSSKTIHLTIVFGAALFLFGSAPSVSQDYQTAVPEAEPYMKSSEVFEKTTRQVTMADGQTRTINDIRLKSKFRPYNATKNPGGYGLWRSIQAPALQYALTTSKGPFKQNHPLPTGFEHVLIHIPGIAVGIEGTLHAEQKWFGNEKPGEKGYLIVSVHRPGYGTSIARKTLRNKVIIDNQITCGKQINTLVESLEGSRIKQGARIALVAHSAGAGCALNAAYHLKKKGKNIEALILQAGFTHEWTTVNFFKSHWFGEVSGFLRRLLPSGKFGRIEDEIDAAKSTLEEFEGKIRIAQTPKQLFDDPAFRGSVDKFLLVADYYKEDVRNGRLVDPIVWGKMKQASKAIRTLHKQMARVNSQNPRTRQRAIDKLQRILDRKRKDIWKPLKKIRKRLDRIAKVYTRGRRHNGYLPHPLKNGYGLYRVSKNVFAKVGSLNVGNSLADGDLGILGRQEYHLVSIRNYFSMLIAELDLIETRSIALGGLAQSADNFEGEQGALETINAFLEALGVDKLFEDMAEVKSWLNDIPTKDSFGQRVTEQIGDAFAVKVNDPGAKTLFTLVADTPIIPFICEGKYCRHICISHQCLAGGMLLDAARAGYQTSVYKHLALFSSIGDLGLRCTATEISNQQCPNELQTKFAGIPPKMTTFPAWIGQDPDNKRKGYPNLAPLNAINFYSDCAGTRMDSDDCLVVNSFVIKHRQSRSWAGGADGKKIDALMFVGGLFGTQPVFPNYRWSRIRNVPILLIHDPTDPLVPFAHSAHVFEKIKEKTFGRTKPIFACPMVAGHFIWGGRDAAKMHNLRVAFADCHIKGSEKACMEIKKLTFRKKMNKDLHDSGSRKDIGGMEVYTNIGKKDGARRVRDYCPTN